MRRYLSVRGGIGDVSKADLDTKAKDNLYLAVNSKWQNDAMIPADRTEIGINTELDIRIEKRMLEAMDDFASDKEPLPDIANIQKAIDLYKLALDFDRRDREGAQPIQNALKKLIEVKDFKELAEKATTFEGYNDFVLPFWFEVEADMKNTQDHVLQFGGPGTFLPDTTSYSQNDAEKLLGILKEQSIALLKMAGLDASQAASYVDDGLIFDKKLSKIVKSTEEWSDYPAIYNPMKYNEFIAKFTSFDINQLLKNILPEIPDKVIVTEPRFLDHLEELFNPDNFAEIKGWMITSFINLVSSYLSQDFRKAAFKYTQAISGQAELTPQKRHAYEITNGRFDEVLGIYYGKRYLGDEAKQDITEMIQNMIKVYESRIKDNRWLSEETKKKAIIKLKALVLKIGYPDKQEKIYDLFQVDLDKSLFENEQEMSKVALKYNLAKLGKRVDKSVFLMPGNMNNACYDPQRNDITFPAGILQAPFYDINQDRSANYGGIGATIAHEISHAFDNNGAKFDEFGNMKNWWTKEDFAEFEKRTQAVIDLYDGLCYGPSKLNGKQVVAENIADLGGLTCAIQANKAEKGNLSELFYNYARSWAQKQRPEAIKTAVAVDVHAPQPTRVNIPVQCQEEFYQEFNVKETDGMWLDPEKRVTIW